ncbi:hypothetical protein L596_019142 [Steinernema carpocapsae]|uniref:Uncharacterized protein n=1 Tax=Steinernema carpocapsae TaxID=34508 RepID=A0A4U5N6U4_STECR|nr:hypothetical protein L596_019142 [Steinernema carpocapsae]
MESIFQIMDASNAEQLANEYEKGELDATKNNGGKRTKSEQVDHKHSHPEGDTRRIVNVAMQGEQKRKEQQQK